MSTLTGLSQTTASSTSANTTSTSANTTAQASKSTSALSGPLSKVYDRVSLQVKSESASLSQLGQYKSAMSDLDAAAGALSKLQASSSADTVAAALQKFATAYNAALNQGSSVNKSGKGSESGTAQTLGDLRRAVSPNSTSTSTSTPSLKFDADTFRKTWSSQVLRKVLQGIGQASGKAADAALAGSGKLASAITHSGQRVKTLTSQQNAVLDAGTDSDASAQTTSTSTSLAAQMGLSAYLSNS